MPNSVRPKSSFLSGIGVLLTLLLWGVVGFAIVYRKDALRPGIEVAVGPTLAVVTPSPVPTWKATIVDTPSPIPSPTAKEVAIVKIETVVKPPQEPIVTQTSVTKALAATNFSPPAHSSTPTRTPTSIHTATPIPLPTRTRTPTPISTPTRTATTIPTSSPIPSPAPEFASILVGRSANGHQIMAVRIGTGPINVLFIGGIHAGFAPSSVTIAQEAQSYFEQHFEELPPDVTLHIIANANPDSPDAPGRLQGRLNGNQVDLNRNWGCNWRQDALWGEQIINGGTGAFSEPETQALRDYILEIRPAAVIFWDARIVNGQVAPGGCYDLSSASQALGEFYGNASAINISPWSYYEVNGDASNWVDAQGIPAVFVMLNDRQQFDRHGEWDKHRAGMLAVMRAYSGDGTP